MAIIAFHGSDYLVDFRLNVHSDARDYVVLGRNFLLLGEYSRCPSPPYHLDSLRTPVYPLFAGALEIVGGPWLLYVVQGILHALSCWLLFHLVVPCFGRAAAWCAALLLATDLMLVISNFEAMSEPLFLFLTLASLRLLVPAILGVDEGAASVGRTASGGLLLALAILTRPTGLYLPFLLVAFFVLAGLVQRRALPALLHAAVFVLLALTPVAAWIARNATVFSFARLTSNDAIMLVYFTGGGAYVVEHGISLDEAHNRIAKEFGLTHPNVTNNPWSGRKPEAEIDAELRAAAFAVISKYPKSLLLSCALGIAKSSVSHNVGTLAHAMDEEWVRPDTNAMLRFDPAASSRLLQNHGVLVVAFVWQLCHSVLGHILCLVGVVIALRDRRLRPAALLLGALLAYFLLTVAIVGSEAYSRSRTPHMPLVFSFAGLPLSRFCRCEVSGGPDS